MINMENKENSNDKQGDMYFFIYMNQIYFRTEVYTYMEL